MGSFLQKRSIRLTLLVALVVIAIVGVVWLREIFAPLLLAMVIAYILDPVADFLERLRMSRILAVTTIFLGVTLLISGALFFGGASLAKGVHVASERLPIYLEQGQEWLERDFPGVKTGIERWREDLEKRFAPEKDLNSNEAMARRTEAFLDATVGTFIDDFLGQEEISSGSVTPESRVPIGGIASAGVDRALSWGVWVVLVPVYIFFFLLEIDPMIRGTRNFLPGRQKERIERIAVEIHRTVSAFFRGRLTICLLKGGLTGIGLFLAGVPFGFALGLASGFLSLIPYVGVWFSLLPALGLSWLEYQSPSNLALVGGIFAAIEVLEGLVLTPTLLGKEVGLHPLTVIVTLLIFGKVLGLLGVLLSIPLAAITKILAREFILPLIEEFAEEKPAPEPLTGEE